MPAHASTVGPLVELLASRVPTSPYMKTGAAGDFLIEKLVEQACQNSEISRWLGATCKPFTGSMPAIEELERKLFRDVLAVPAQVVARRSPGASASRELTVAAAIFETLATSSDPRGLAVALGTLTSETVNRCAPGRPDPNEPLGVAAYVLRRLLDEEPALFERPEEHAYRVVQQALSELGVDRPVSRVPGYPSILGRLSPGRRQAVRSLLTALQQARDAQALLESPATLETGLRQMTRALLAITTNALRAATGDRDFALAQQIHQTVRAIVLADASQALESVLGLAGTAVPGLDEAEEEIRRGFRLAQARDEAEARRILRAAVTGLGPWSEKLLFHINGGIPRLQRSDFRFTGDVLGGYNGDHFGGAARGSMGAYDLITDELATETLRRSAEGDFWWVGDFGPKVSLEIRLAGGVAVYETDRVDLTGQAADDFKDETSIMGRGAGLAALRAQPSQRFALGVWLGGGFQVEAYEVIRIAGPDVFKDEEQETGSLVDARARLQYAIVPKWLVGRLRADLLRYGITRDTVSTTISMGTVEPVAEKEDARQLELVARAFIDFEVARFFGFVPSLHAGIDFIRRNAPVEDSQSLVPVYGAGVRRVTF